MYEGLTPQAKILRILEGFRLLISLKYSSIFIPNSIHW